MEASTKLVFNLFLWNKSLCMLSRVPRARVYNLFASQFSGDDFPTGAASQTSRSALYVVFVAAQNAPVENIQW